MSVTRIRLLVLIMKVLTDISIKQISLKRPWTALWLAPSARSGVGWGLSWLGGSMDGSCTASFRHCFFLIRCEGQKNKGFHVPEGKYSHQYLLAFLLSFHPSSHTVLFLSCIPCSHVPSVSSVWSSLRLHSASSQETTKPLHYGQELPCYWPLSPPAWMENVPPLRRITRQNCLAF